LNIDLNKERNKRMNTNRFSICKILCHIPLWFLLGFCALAFFSPLCEKTRLFAEDNHDDEMYVMIRIDSRWVFYENRSSGGQYRYRTEGSATASITGRMKLVSKTSLHKSYATQELEVKYTYEERKIDERPQPECPELVWTLSGTGSGNIVGTSRLKVNYPREKGKDRPEPSWEPDYRFSCLSLNTTIPGKVRQSEYLSSGCKEYEALSREVNFGSSYIEAAYDGGGNMTGRYSWSGGFHALDITKIGAQFRKDHRTVDMPPVENDVAHEMANWRFSPSPILLILQKEKDEWIDITDPPNIIAQPKIVGEKIELRGAVFPEEKDPERGQWTISGEFIEDFKVEGERGYTDKLEKEELKNPEIKFHWWDAGDDITVKYAATADGKQLEAQARFTVREPELSINSEVPDGKFEIGMMSSGIKELLYWAIGEPKPTITFTHGSLPPGFGGETQYVQLVDTSGIVEKDNVHDPCWEFEIQGLDGTYPYAPGPRTEDTPGVQVSWLDLNISVINNYEMYLMYKPEREGAIFVPLRVVDWKWTGLAMREGINDIFSLFGSAVTKNPRDKDAQKYPEWDRISPEKPVWVACK
jgi:hypothetical protein